MSENGERNLSPRVARQRVSPVPRKAMRFNGVVILWGVMAVLAAIVFLAE